MRSWEHGLKAELQSHSDDHNKVTALTAAVTTGFVIAGSSAHLRGVLSVGTQHAN